MAHTREIDLSAAAADKQRARCHLMPCSIEHNQLEIKAREYFEPTIRELKSGDDDEQGRAARKSQAEDGGDNLIASFRGRPLLGKKIQVPEGHVGRVIGTANSPFGKISKQFDEFIYWNWDQMPEKEDPPVKALNWLKVSKSIHDPIE